MYIFFLSRQNETVTNEKIAQHAFIQHELEQRIELLFFAFCCCCFRAHAPPYRTYNTNHKHNSSAAADAQQISML